jgi:hypothetical protein
LGDVCSRLALGFGSGLSRSLLCFVVWLEAFSARYQHTFRANRRVRDFSILASAGCFITAHRFLLAGESD